MRMAIILTILFAIPGLGISQTTWYVPDDFPTIQGGIDAAVNGDTIIVRPNTYVENIDFKGKAITVQSDQGVNVTIIDGNNTGSVVTFSSGEGMDSVLEGFTLTNGDGTYDGSGNNGGGIYCENSSPMIRNNTITENYTYMYGEGGGIYCISASPMITDNTITWNYSFLASSGICCHRSSPTITNNTIAKNPGFGIQCWSSTSVTITNNTITGNGIFCYSTSGMITNNTITGNAYSGIYCESSSPTITNNAITGNSGRGIICSSSASPTIKNNAILGNFDGGIVCEDDSSPNITNNNITGNSADSDGGGIYCNDSSPMITSNIITGNTAAIDGSGIYCCSSSPSITNNTITGNLAESRGGGIFCISSSSMTITNNAISNNSAMGNGGGIYCRDSSSMITSNTITGNSAVGNSGGICCISSSLTITNTILWDNAAPTGSEIWIGTSSQSSTLFISYSDVKGGQTSVSIDPNSKLTWGPGMIDSDPLFAAPNNNDFHLTFPSPGKDTGDNSAVTELYDFEGDPRIAWGGTVDMGADEFYTHLYITGDQTPGGSIQGKLVGLPGTSPVRLFIGLGGVRPTPLPTMYGDLWLLPPRLSIPLVPIPADGVLEIPATIPLSPPAPYDIPMQGLVGLNSDSLTNLCVLEVR